MYLQFKRIAFPGAPGNHEVHNNGIAAFVSEQHVVFSHSSNVYICSHPPNTLSVLCTASCEVRASGPVFAAVYSGTAADGGSTAQVAVWSAASATPAEGAQSDNSAFFVRSVSTSDVPGCASLLGEDAGDSLLRVTPVPGHNHVAFALTGSGGVLAVGLAALGSDGMQCLRVIGDTPEVETLFCDAKCVGTDLCISLATSQSCGFIQVSLNDLKPQEVTRSLPWERALPAHATLLAASCSWEGKAVCAFVAQPDGSHTVMTWNYSVQQGGQGAWQAMQPFPVNALGCFTAPLLDPCQCAPMEAGAGGALTGNGPVTMRCLPVEATDGVGPSPGVACSVFIGPDDDQTEDSWQLLQVAPSLGRGCLINLTPPAESEGFIVDAQLASVGSLAVLLPSSAGCVDLLPPSSLPSLGSRQGHTEALDDDEDEGGVATTTAAAAGPHVLYTYLPPWLQGNLQQAMAFQASPSTSGGAAGGGGKQIREAAAVHALATGVDVASAAVLSVSSTPGGVATALATAAATAAEALHVADTQRVQLTVAQNVMSARPSARMLHNAREAVANGSSAPDWALAAQELLHYKTVRLGVLIALTRHVCGVPQALAWNVGLLAAQCELLQQLTESPGLTSDQVACLQAVMSSCVKRWGIAQEELLRAGVSALLMFFAFSDRTRAIVDSSVLDERGQTMAPSSAGGAQAAQVLPALQSITAQCVLAFVSAPRFTQVQHTQSEGHTALTAWVGNHWPVSELASVALHSLKNTWGDAATPDSVASAVASTYQCMAITSHVLKAVPTGGPPLSSLTRAVGAAMAWTDSSNLVPALRRQLLQEEQFLHDTTGALATLCVPSQEPALRVAALLGACARLVARSGSPDAAASLLLTVAQVEWASAGATAAPEIAFLLGVYFSQTAAGDAADEMLRAVVQCLADQAEGGELARVAAWCCHSIQALHSDVDAGVALPERLVQATAGPEEDRGSAVLGDTVGHVNISGDAVTALSVLLQQCEGTND